MVTIMSVARVGRLALDSGDASRGKSPINDCGHRPPRIPGMARAQDASAWDAEPHAAARLIAGAALQSADAAWLRAGIEIRLDTGWKTYWRYPGDSGVPPTLDFAGSENVKSVTVLWPAPTRFADGAAATRSVITATSYCRCASLPTTPPSRPRCT